MGTVPGGNQGEKTLRRRQKLRERYMAKCLLAVETVSLLHLNFLGGQNIYLFVLLLLSLSFAVTGILPCS